MANKFSFKILTKDKSTKARSGIIQTLHGQIETPCFVPVGTAGTVKSGWAKKGGETYGVIWRLL